MTSPSDTRDLLALPPRWVTLRGEPDGGGPVAVTLLDEAVALAAPFPDFALQVGIGLVLQQPDDAGQVSPEEKPALKAFERALVHALGPAGRLVAVLTVDGVREYVAYVSDVEVLMPWREAPPEGMTSHDWQVQVLQDPSWLGLREIAGLLQPGEELLGPLPEIGPDGVPVVPGDDPR